MEAFIKAITEMIDIVKGRKGTFVDEGLRGGSVFENENIEIHVSGVVDKLVEHSGWCPFVYCTTRKAL